MAPTACAENLSWSDDHRVQRAISDTLPAKPGHVERAVWELARHLKAIRELKGNPAREMEAIVRRWHTLAGSHTTMPDYDEIRAMFRHAWEKVIWPADQPPLDWAVAQALAFLPKDAKQYDTLAIRNLAGVCYHLAARNPDGVFFLSARCAADVFGVDPMCAHRWLRMLCVDGVLAVEEKGTPGKHGRATRFRWTGVEPLPSDVAGKAQPEPTEPQPLPADVADSPDDGLPW